jgi:hypothetical protein
VLTRLWNICERYLIIFLRRLTHGQVQGTGDAFFNSLCYWWVDNNIEAFTEYPSRLCVCVCVCVHAHLCVPVFKPTCKTEYKHTGAWCAENRWQSSFWRCHWVLRYFAN